MKRVVWASGALAFLCLLAAVWLPSRWQWLVTAALFALVAMLVGGTALNESKKEASNTNVYNISGDRNAER